MRMVLPLVLLLLSGCAATHYSIEPTEPPTYWYQGVGYVERKQNDVAYLVGPGEATSTSLQFNVQITNDSKKPLTISSEIFSLQSPTNQIPADDPEKLISLVDQEIKRLNTWRDPLGGDFIGSISDIGNFSDAALKRKKERDEREATYKENLSEQQTAKDKIASRFLRRTTLRQGESVSGVIQFSMNEQQKSKPLACILKNHSAEGNGGQDLQFQVVSE